MVLSHQKLPAMNRAFLKVSTLSSLRRPHLFRLAGKDGGEKRGAWLRLVPTASEFRQETDLTVLLSHQHTSLESYYAPPVILESNLTAVAVS